MKRTKARMARAAWRVGGWEGLPLLNIRILREVNALDRWHRAVSNFGRRK